MVTSSWILKCMVHWEGSSSAIFTFISVLNFSSTAAWASFVAPGADENCSINFLLFLRLPFQLFFTFLIYRLAKRAEMYAACNCLTLAFCNHLWINMEILYICCQLIEKHQQPQRSPKSFYQQFIIKWEALFNRSLSVWKNKHDTVHICFLWLRRHSNSSILQWHLYKLLIL